MVKKYQIQTTINGEKTVALEDFFTGPNTTILKKGEVLTQILVPRESVGSKGIFLKHCTGNSNDIGLANITILLDADSKKGVCNKIRIAMGAVAPTPIRAKQAEMFLSGNRLDPDTIAETARLASGNQLYFKDVLIKKQNEKKLRGALKWLKSIKFKQLLMVKAMNYWLIQK